MKKCVKIISILLVLTLLLSSCSADLSGVLSLLPWKTLCQITDEFPGDGIVDGKIVGDTVVLLTSKATGDENIEYYLTEINAKTSKVKLFTTLDSSLVTDPCGLDFNENGDIVTFGYDYSDDNDETICVTYSFDTLEKNGDLETYTPSLPEITYEDSPIGISFIRGDTVSTYECSDIPNQPIHTFLLRSKPDSVIFANELEFSLYSTYEDLAVGKDYYDYENDDGTETLLVYDFDNSVLVNSMTTQKPGDENLTTTVSFLFLNDKYVFFSQGTNNNATDEYSESYYVWRYRRRALNEPFDSTVKTCDELEKLNAKMCEQIKDSTGINVYINSDRFDFYEKGEDYYLSGNAKPLETHLLLLRLRAFLDYLPENFAREMYTDLSLFEYDGFDIFIGDSIEGTANAYAATFLNSLTLVFSTASSDFRTVAHEFMHIMDTRIEDCLGKDVSFYELWKEYNPEDFEYSGYDEENGYFEDEKYDDWFVSAYSMSTDGEDRADLFSYLFVDSFSETLPPDWYEDKEPLSKKADYLIKMIREAYPSLKNVKTAQWEKTVTKKND